MTEHKCTQKVCCLSLSAKGFEASRPECWGCQSQTAPSILVRCPSGHYLTFLSAPSRIRAASVAVLDAWRRVLAAMQSHNVKSRLALLLNSP